MRYRPDVRVPLREHVVRDIGSIGNLQVPVECHVMYTLPQILSTSYGRLIVLL